MRDLSNRRPDSNPLAAERGKLIHTFGALAELGQEVANRQGFHETIRTSLHLILGSLAIMRGGVARFSRFSHELNMVAGRGLGDNFPLSLALCHEDERQFLATGLYPIENAMAKALPFFQVYDRSLEIAKVELVMPLIMRGELLGAVFLGEKASGDRYTSHDKDVLCAMGRHIGVAIAQRNLLAELERRAEENHDLYENLKTTYNDTVRHLPPP